MERTVCRQSSNRRLNTEIWKHCSHLPIVWLLAKQQSLFLLQRAKSASCMTESPRDRMLRGLRVREDSRIMLHLWSQTSKLQSSIRLSSVKIKTRNRGTNASTRRQLVPRQARQFKIQRLRTPMLSWLGRVLLLSWNPSSSKTKKSKIRWGSVVCNLSQPSRGSQPSPKIQRRTKRRKTRSDANWYDSLFLSNWDL